MSILPLFVVPISDYRNSLCRSASVSSFTPPTLTVGVPSATLTIAGTALYANVSVASVWFVLGTNCSSTSTVVVSTALLQNASFNSMVATVGGAGIVTPGQYTPCINFVAANGTLTAVGNTTISVG